MRYLSLSLVLALAGALAGCGGDDDGPPLYTGPSMMQTLDVMCTSAIVNGGAPFSIPVDMVITLEDDPVQDAPIGVQIEGSVSVGTDLVNTLTGIAGGDAIVTITEMAVDVDVAGGTPAALELTAADAPFDIVFMMDTPAVVAPDMLQQDVMLDASGSLSFTLAGASLGLIVEDLLPGMVIPLNIPGMMGDTILCQLPDPNTPITFPVP